MKAAIIGHGKMGREIEKILLERGHCIGAVIDEANASELDAAHLAGIDVALEFTTARRRPTATSARASTQAIPVVSGTTGWTDRLAELQELLPREGRCAVLRLELLPGRQPDVPPQPQLAGDDRTAWAATTYGSRRCTTPRRRTRRAARPSRWPKGIIERNRRARRAG